MVETITAVGMVLSTMQISEYDKRLVILTKEFGKITAFARGARRQNSSFLAGSQPMTFGEFTLYRGRNSYTVTAINVKEYFSGSMKDFNKMSYGMYFIELADYYCRENIEAAETLKLLYLSMKAINNKLIDDKLIRVIYELKTMVINGEYPNVFSCINCGSKENLDYFDENLNSMICSNCHKTYSSKKEISNSTVYSLQYIVSSSLDKLYTFNVNEEVLGQLQQIIGGYLKLQVDKEFRTLEFLENSY